MLRWRVPLGITLVAALAGICWLDAHCGETGTWLVPTSMLIGLLASGELLWLFRSAGIEAGGRLVYLGNLAIVGAHWPWLSGRMLATALADPLILPALVFTICGLVALLVEIVAYRRPGGVTLRLAATVFALFYVGLLLSFLSLLLLTGESGGGMALLLTVIMIVKLADVGAYTVGRLVGRNRLAPYLSPGKTLEGAAGALIFACAGSWLGFQWLWPRVVGQPAGIGWSWLPFGLIVGLAGILGDLAESLLKRDLGRKDSSAWLPGFGGVLDIVDSLLFAGPVAYLCVRLGLLGS